MNERGWTASEVRKRLDQAWSRDMHFDQGRVLGSMYTTPHPIAREAHDRFMEANLGNPGLYPGTKELESEVVAMMAELHHGRNLWGMVCGGGTEANITALWMARNAYRKKAVVYAENAHFSVAKAVDLLGMESRKVPLDEHYKLSTDHLEEVLDDAAAVVAVAGSTELGLVDPIPKIAELCGGVHLHIDAAFGGMVLPFLRETEEGRALPPYDFAVDGVDSLSVDPHKMGMATIPAGVLLARRGDLIRSIEVCTPYLTATRQASLSGTRSSAGVAGAYAVLRHLGREGYRRIVSECWRTTGYLLRRTAEIGLSPIVPPETNVVAFPCDRVHRVLKGLGRRGWSLSKTRFPPGLRIVVMPHVTTEVVDRFVPDLETVLRAEGVL